MLLGWSGQERVGSWTAAVRMKWRGGSSVPLKTAPTEKHTHRVGGMKRLREPKGRTLIAGDAMNEASPLSLSDR